MKTLEDGAIESPNAFLTRHNLEEVETLITRRKAVWMAHAERGRDEITLEAMEKERTENTRWWRTYAEDLARFGLTPDLVKQYKDNDAIRCLTRIDLTQ